MELLKAIALGIVQGLTEFLPVSSSGHLVIGSQLLDFHGQSVFFDVCLHLGTLVSVIIVFRADLLAMVKAPCMFIAGKKDETVRRYLLWDVYVVLATLPAVCVGLFLKDSAEQIFDTIWLAYCMLAVTGLLMVATKYISDRDEPVNWYRSVLVGCAQACAIMPGLSRSGSTIFVGMALGIARDKIARFSFIMSIPAILGAVVLQFDELFHNPPTTDVLLNIFMGTLMAAVSGYFAIKLLFGIIRIKKLQWFGYYCLLLAATGLGYYFFAIVI